MTNTMLLAGATGHIGSALARQMLKQNLHFRALVRDPIKAKALRHTNVELVQGEFEDRESLKKALKGIEKVFLCSSSSQNQAELQGNVVETAYHAGVKHIVKISMIGTDRESDINLLRWHAMTEDQIRDYKMAYTFLRPHFFMQNFFEFAPSIKTQNMFQAALKAKISMVDVEDIATVALKALTVPGHEHSIYTVTGPEALSYDDAAQKLSAKLSRTIRYVELSYDDAKKAMIENQMPEWFADDLIKLQKFFNAGMAGFVSPTVEDLTGRKPRSFLDFLTDNLEAFQ